MNSLNSPKVSVVIPTYNRQDLIKDAIQSVFQQTYRDIEIVVCDDKSSDQTVDVVKSMQKMTDLDFTVDILPFNMGVSAARNRAIYLARGDYIAFLDSDDTWLPGKLEKQIAFLDENPDFIGVGCGYFIKKNHHEYKEVSLVSGFSEHSSEIFQILYQCYILTSCFLVRKDILVLAGMFDSRLRNSEDRDLWWRLPKFGRIGYINEPLVKYLMHEHGLSKQMKYFTSETYILAVKRSILYWKDRLTRKEMRKILSISHLLVAIDHSGKKNYFNSVKNAFVAITYGHHVFDSFKFIVMRTVNLFR